MNNITLVVDYDRACQFHDLLCDLITHLKEGAPGTPEETEARIKADMEYVEEFQHIIHKAMEHADDRPTKE